MVARLMPSLVVLAVSLVVAAPAPAQDEIPSDEAAGESFDVESDASPGSEEALGSGTEASTASTAEPPMDAPAPAPVSPELEGSIVDPIEGAPSTVIVVGSGDTYSLAASADLQMMMDARLRRTVSLQPVDTARVLLGPDADAGASDLERARREFEAGRRSYEELMFDEAVQRFDAAISAYVDAMPALDDLQEFAEAFARLGATHFFAGDRNGAHQAFKNTIVLVPDFAPDPSLFNPPLMEAFNNARWEVSASPKGVLTVTSRPSNAEVWVDGGFRGLTPITLEGLPLGTHYVVLRSRGHAPVSDTAEISPADPLTLDLSLQPGMATAAYQTAAKSAIEDAGPPEMPETVGALAGMFDAQRIVLGRVTSQGERSEARFTAYDVGARARISQESVEWEPASQSARPRVVAFADAYLPGVAAAAAPIEAVKTGGGLPPFARTWWFWTATGAAVAAIAAGAVVAVNAQQPGAGPGPDHGLILFGIP